MEDKLDLLMEQVRASSATITALQAGLDEKLAGFKKELLVDQEEIAGKAAKKAKLESSYHFKSKGNEDQFTFNGKIADSLEEAKLQLGRLESMVADLPSTSTGTPKMAEPLQKAKDALATGERLVSQRQKAVKLADRSEFGWKLVKNYEADELADDEDDEKRINKAEKAAEKEAAAGRKKSTASRLARVSSSKHFGAYQGQSYRPYGGWGQGPSGGSARPFTPATRAIGPCHACGDYGHLRFKCPRLLQGYPFMVSSASSEFDALGLSDDHYNSTSLSFSNECIDHHGPEPSRFWEIEHSVSCVKGSIRRSAYYWEHTLRAPAPILDIVQHGYVLPLLSKPKAFCSPNHSSVFKFSEFVDEAVSELLGKQCIKLVSETPHVCSPLLVVESGSGKKRLVINLKYLNLFLWKDKFKYEDIRTALNYFEQGEYMFTFDLKSGYHHVDIHEGSQTFLGFSWRDKYYEFTVLPFGLSTACYVFTKLLRPIVRFVRSLGIKIVVYIDDGIVVVKGFDEALSVSEKVKDILSHAGLVLNEEKSRFLPSMSGSWLGFDIDLEKGEICIPSSKIEKLKGQLREALGQDFIPAKVLASIIGRIISMSLAVGSIARLRTRYLYSVLDSRPSWHSSLFLDTSARAELSFWLEGLHQFNGQPLWRSPSAVRVVYSDVSDTGFGSYIVEQGNQVVHGQWSESESKESSTWRELRAVSLSLEAVAQKLANLRVKWFTDNQNVVRIIQVGSKKQKLQQEALSIFRLTVNHNILLEPEWVPREENVLADQLSRIIDYDDWGLSCNMFSFLDARWGPHSVDRFASGHNAKLPRFNSRYWAKDTEAVDAFTVDWNGENNYFCPPVHLVPRVLFHAEACGCEGTLVVPEWPSAVFWPLICPKGDNFATFISDWMYLPLSTDLIVEGIRGAHLFKGKFPNTNVLALRFDFTRRKGHGIN